MVTLGIQLFASPRQAAALIYLKWTASKVTGRPIMDKGGDRMKGKKTPDMISAIRL